MLPNQVPTKDLFSYPLRLSSHNSCSQGNSTGLRGESGFQDSQIYHGSQSQPESPSRRMFQRYSSRGSIFKPDGSSNSQQDFLHSQRTRARERDDREFLQNMMSIVSESSSAVRFALQSFRDSIEAKQGKCEENLSLSFTKHELEKTCSKILESLYERDKKNEELHQLDLQLSKKDAVISGLEKQIKDFLIRDQQMVIDTIKDCHIHQQTMMEDKLKKLLNVTSDQLKLYDRQISWQNDRETDHEDFQKELFKEQQKHLKHLEERLLSEMSNIQEEVSVKQTKLGSYNRQQLLECHHQQTKAVEKCVHEALTEGLQQSCKETSSFFSQQRQEINNTCGRLRQELQQFVHAELKKQLLQYEESVNHILSRFETSSSNKMDETRINVTNPESKGMWMTLPLRSPKPNFHAQDESLKDNRFRCDVESITIRSPEFNISSYSYSSVPASTSGLFGSPWNSNRLFERSEKTSKPSPVATVSPMMRNSSSAILPNSYSDKQAATKADKQNERKQKGIVHPQRQSQRQITQNNSRYPTRSAKQKHQDSANKEQFPTKSQITSHYQDSNYGHCKDLRSKKKASNNKRKSTSWDENEPQWLKEARLQRSSPISSAISKREDSPTVAAMGMVMKRKVKCTRTPNIHPQLSSRADWKSAALDGDMDRNKNAFSDLLGSSCFKSSDDGVGQSSEEYGTLVWEGKVRRKDASKRKLCDGNYDTQITEITQAIKKQLLRVHHHAIPR